MTSSAMAVLAEPTSKIVSVGFGFSNVCGDGNATVRIQTTAGMYVDGSVFVTYFGPVDQQA